MSVRCSSQKHRLFHAREAQKGQSHRSSKVGVRFWWQLSLPVKSIWGVTLLPQVRFNLLQYPTTGKFDKATNLRGVGEGHDGCIGVKIVRFWLYVLEFSGPQRRQNGLSWGSLGEPRSQGSWTGLQECKSKVLPSYMTFDKPLDLCFLGLFPALLQGSGAAT